MDILLTNQISADFSIADLLRLRAVHQPQQRAFTFLLDGESEEVHVTYAELDRQARAIGALLQSMKATGERALLVYPSGLEYISAFFGCLYAGVIAVPAYPPRRNHSMLRLQSIVADAQTKVVLTTGPILSTVRRWFAATPELENLPWIATDALKDRALAAWEPPPLSGESLAFLQYTSGSTGTPKGVMVSHGNLIHNSAMICERWEHNSDCIGVSWLPIFHDMGLVAGVLQPLYAGFPAILMAPTSFLQRPSRWLHAISTYKGTTSCAPNFAYDLCVHKITPEESRTLDLRSWNVAVNGAEPVRRETLARFAEKFGPYGFKRESFVPGYGLAEATLMVSSGWKGARPTLKTVNKVELEQHKVVDAPGGGDVSRVCIGCGSSGEKQKLLIVDPMSMFICQPDEVGEIWVSGDSIAQGYWKRPDETAQIFQAYLADTGEGPFLRTGDLGFLCDNELFVSGRLKDLIVIRGHNYYPQDIELTVEQCHPALRPACGAAFSVDIADEERLVVVQELERSHRNIDVDTVADIIRQTVAEQHELQVYAVVLLKVGSIPKTSSGKIQRSACRSAFLTGNLNIAGCSIIALGDRTPLSDMAVFSRQKLLALAPEERLTALRSYLQARIARLKGVASALFASQKPSGTLGLDSLQAAELVHQLEVDLGLNMPLISLLENQDLEHFATQMLDQLETPSSLPISRTPIQPPPLRGSTSQEQDLPLSFSQEHLWFLHQLEPEGCAYNIAVSLHLKGSLRTEVLQQCLNEITRRHEILRTTFVFAQERPIQVIAANMLLSLPVVDLEALSEGARETAVQRIASEEARLPFYLAQGPLFRVKLLHLAEEEYRLLLVMQHIISDGRSIGEFLQELCARYKARSTGVSASLAVLPFQYKDFADWQRQWLQGETLEAELSYWRKQLYGAMPSLNLPLDQPQPAPASSQGARYRFVLPQTLVESIAHFSRHQGVTAFMTMLAALKIVLFTWTGQHDITVGTIVGNRDRFEFDKLIGCFINFLPLRSTLVGSETAQEFLSHVKSMTLEAYSHQFCPFEKIVWATNPPRKVNQNPLFNVAFLMQSFHFPWTYSFSDTLQASFEGTIDTQTSLLDLRFIAGEKHCAEGMSFECEYNPGLFQASTIQHLVHSYYEALERLVAFPETRLSEFNLSNALKARVADADEQQPVIALATTFTADPIKEALAFWMQKLTIAGAIAFAPYDQVFQQLLNPTSLLSTNQQGINVILLRIEDWHGWTEDTQSTYEEVERNGRDFIATLKSAAEHAAVPYIVCVCPSSRLTEHAERHTAFFQLLEERLAAELDSIRNVYTITCSELNVLYPVSAYYDAYGDELARLPFTPLFFTALGTMVARKIYALKAAPYKVIVLDCDQTLWKGVCGEEDVLGVEIDAPRKALQEFMVRQFHSGMLICLCSKNNEEDVLKVFEHHPEMRLQLDQIVSWRINWKPKSENIKSLSRELQLGLENFIFIDEDPVECAEVRARCPEVLTLQLPQEPENIPTFLQHIWAFDHLNATDEDRRRTVLYQQNVARERVRTTAPTFEAFLSGLDLKVHIARMERQHLARVSQLTQRTNQFNCTTIRRSESEMQALYQGENFECFVVEVSDRFGDYGLVGAMIFEPRSDCIYTDTFLLSCRALGRGVEHRMLAWLGEVAKERDLRFVAIPYVSTQKNGPAWDFLEAGGAQFKQVLDGCSVFRFPSGFAASFTYHPGTENPVLAERHIDTASVSQIQAGPALLNQVATELHMVEQIFEVIQARRRSQLNSHDSDSANERMQEKHATPLYSYAEARTPLEEHVRKIWTDLLDCGQIGIYDNFFDRGGHSLLAIQLLSRIRTSFAVELPLRMLFESAFTIAELAKAIEQHQIEQARDQEIAEILSDLDTLSDDEVNALLASEGQSGITPDSLLLANPSLHFSAPPDGFAKGSGVEAGTWLRPRSGNHTSHDSEPRSGEAKGSPAVSDSS